MRSFRWLVYEKLTVHCERYRLFLLYLKSILWVPQVLVESLTAGLGIVCVVLTLKKSRIYLSDK